MKFTIFFLMIFLSKTYAATCSKNAYQLGLIRGANSANSFFESEYKESPSCHGAHFGRKIHGVQIQNFKLCLKDAARKGNSKKFISKHAEGFRSGLLSEMRAYSRVVAGSRCSAPINPISYKYLALSYFGVSSLK